MKSLAFDASVVSYLVAALLCLGGLVWGRNPRLLTLGHWLYALGVLCNGIYLGHRWVLSGRPPLSNTFEVLVLSAFCVGLLYLALRLRIRADYLGTFPAGMSLICITYATLLDSTIEPLMPALQNSFWLTIHVILCLLGYGAFVVSFVAGLAFLMGLGPPHRPVAVFVAALFLAGAVLAFALPAALHREVLHLTFSGGTVALVAAAALVLAGLLTFPLGAALARMRIYEFFASREELDPLIYRSVTFGFPLLGLGIVAGAVWANQAWGTYWSWDPKETASLVTWLIYSLYLHFRYLRGWKGARSAWTAVGGFASVLFTWFGVNYLLSGLHAYA